MLTNGFNGTSFKGLADYLLSTSGDFDPYMCLADFRAYLNACEDMDALYRKPLKWHKQALKNISQMGYFSSDRCIEEYAKSIWNLQKI